MRRGGLAAAGRTAVPTVAPPSPTWHGLPAYFITHPGEFDGTEPSGTNVGGTPRLATAPRAATADHRDRDREGRSDGAPAWLRGRHLGQRRRVLRRRGQGPRRELLRSPPVAWRHATRQRPSSRSPPTPHRSGTSRRRRTGASWRYRHSCSMVPSVTSRTSSWRPPARALNTAGAHPPGTLRAAGPWASWPGWPTERPSRSTGSVARDGVAIDGPAPAGHVGAR